MAKAERSPSGEVIFEIEDPIIIKMTQLRDQSVDLLLQRLDQPANPIRYPGINSAKITIPTLDGGKYKYTIVSKFTSKLNPAITSERVFEGEVTIPEATTTTSSTTPASGTTFGSTLGVPFDFELELNGNPFSTTFERKVTTDLVSRLNNAATLKTELTFFLIGKGSITQEISRKFLNPDIGIDLELERVAGEIISKTQSLDKEIKSTQDITLFSSPDNEKLRDELATVILAYNVEFPPGTKAPPISATADPVLAGLIKGLLEDEIIYKESSAVEDETKQIQKQAEKLTLFLEKDKHDMQGLLTIIQNPINKDNAIKLRDVFINQLGHFKKDITDTINESKKLGFLRPNLAQFKGIQEKMSSYSKKEEIKADTSFTEDKFITSAGKKLLSSYNSKIKSANDIIDEHNSLIDGIKNELDQIDLDKIDAELVKLAGLDKLLTVFTTWIPKAIENLNMLKTQEEIEKIPNMITSDVISHLQSASEIFNKDRVSVAEVLEDIKKVNKTIGDITTITRKKGSTAHGISAWFSRKSASLDSAVSDLKTLEIKMRELLKPAEVAPITVSTTKPKDKAKPIAEATAIATTNVNITLEKRGGGKGTSGDGGKGTSGDGGKGSGIGGRRPTTVTPRPTRYKFEGDALAIYTALKTRAQNTIDDLEHAKAGTAGKKRVSTLKNIFNPSKAVHKATLENEGLDHIPWGDFKKELNQFKKSYWKDSWASESEMEEDIKNKRRIAFISKGKLIEIKRRYDTHAASDINMMKSHQEDILNAVKVDIDGVMNEVDKLLRQLDLQRRENKSAIRTAATSAIGPPTGTPANVT